MLWNLALGYQGRAGEEEFECSESIRSNEKGKGRSVMCDENPFFQVFFSF